MFCRILGFCNVQVEDWKAKGNQACHLYTEPSWPLTSHKLVLFLSSVCSCGAELHNHDNQIQYKLKSAKPMQINIWERINICRSFFLDVKPNACRKRYNFCYILSTSGFTRFFLEVVIINV